MGRMRRMIRNNPLFRPPAEAGSLILQIDQGCPYNHSSNVVPLEGRLPKDRQRLLQELDVLLESGTLDDRSPGSMPLWL